MKKYCIIGVLILIVIIAIIVSTLYVNHTANYSTLHISPVMCEYMLSGATPNEFCNCKGEGTFLENKYLQAKVDTDGCLILTLKNETIYEWKNTFTALQVLQCVLGDTRDIGITIDYSKDFMDYMKDANTCGYEISEDFTKVIESSQDSSWYFPFTTIACAMIQVFQGKTCTEIKVEHIEIDDNGEVIETFIYPDDIDTPVNNVE